MLLVNLSNVLLQQLGSGKLRDETRSLRQNILRNKLYQMHCSEMFLCASNFFFCSSVYTIANGIQNVLNALRQNAFIC